MCIVRVTSLAEGEGAGSHAGENGLLKSFLSCVSAKRSSLRSQCFRAIRNNMSPSALLALANRSELHISINFRDCFFEMCVGSHFVLMCQFATCGRSFLVAGMQGTSQPPAWASHVDWGFMNFLACIFDSLDVRRDGDVSVKTFLLRLCLCPFPSKCKSFV